MTGVDIGVLVDKLDGFETSQEIAQFLQSQGITARRRRPDSCAITQWIKQESDNENIQTYIERDWSGNREFGEIRDGNYDVGFDAFHGAIYRTSEVVAQFIREFDNGQYPDLIDWGWENDNDYL